MFELIGEIAVGLVGVVILAIVAYNLFDVTRTAVMGTDFLRWYIAQSKKTDPTYKMKVNIVSAWIEAFKTMYEYGDETSITHNNGAKYKPFSRV